MKTILKNKLFVFLSALVMLFCGVCGMTMLTHQESAKADDGSNPTLTIESNNLSYADSIYILYAVSNDGFDRTKSEIKLLFWDELQEEYVVGTETYAVTSNQSTTVNEKNCLIFYSKGIAAKEMTDTIYARAYVQIDGQDYYSKPTKFSVLEYVYTMREYTVNENQEHLYDMLLAYGAAAQTLFDYKTDRLANNPYYSVSVENGILADGFTFGRFTDGETITLTANSTASNGDSFLYWQDENGTICSENETFNATVTQDKKYTAIYGITDDENSVEIPEDDSSSENSSEEIPEEPFSPVFPENAVDVADDIWRADKSALSLETYAVPPTGFTTVTEFDWLNNLKFWATTQCTLPTTMFDAETDLSGYSDIYFAIKIVDGWAFVNGLDETEFYTGNDWLYVHYQQTENGCWTLTLNTVDGYTKKNVQTIDADSYKIESENVTYPTLRGLMQSSTSGGLYPQRANRTDPTLVYMTNVLGVIKTSSATSDVIDE